MRATAAEFRHRSWVIVLIFLAALACYQVDPVNAGAAIARMLLGGHYNLHSPHDRLVIHSVFAFAAAVMTTAAALRTWASAYLKSQVAHDRNLHVEALVADGPYRYVRNPLYLSGLFLSAGLGLLLSRLGWFVLMIPLAVFLLRLIGREEAELRKTQGESYAAYCAAVPRLWPAFRARVAAGGMQPRWKQALAGESFYWFCAVALAAFAVTFNAWIAFGIILAARAGHAIYLSASRRHARAGFAGSG